jgi:hypothetical protein
MPPLVTETAVKAVNPLKALATRHPGANEDRAWRKNLFFSRIRATQRIDLVAVSAPTVLYGIAPNVIEQRCSSRQVAAHREHWLN